MKPIFSYTAKEGKKVYNNEHDVYRFLMENEGKQFLETHQELVKSSAKDRMYAYYHGPLLDCAYRYYLRAGWEMMDKVQAENEMMKLFFREFYKNPGGKYEMRLLRKSEVTKERFLDYLQACIIHIEMDLEGEIPDSQEWKNFKYSEKRKV